MSLTREPPHPPPLIEREPQQPAVSLLPGWVTGIHRNRHATIPLLMPIAFLAAALILVTHPRWHEVIVTAAVVGTIAMWLAAPHKWDRAKEVWYARCSVVLAAGWLTAASFLGINWWMLAVLGAGCMAWGIPFYLHKRPRPKVDTALLIAEWDEWWQEYAEGWGVPGSKVVGVMIQGPMEVLVVQCRKGKQSAQLVEQAAHLIESALDGYVRHGMVKVRINALRPSQAFVSLKRENPLGNAVEWDQSLAPQTVTEAAPVGVTEGGELIDAVLLVNWFIVGRSRSGKSNQLSVMLATITGCPDALVWLIDRKGGRAARPWMPAVDWVAVTMDEIRLMLRTADAEVRARAMHAYNGEEQLRPTPEVPAIFLVVDEAAEVTGLNGEAYCAALVASIAAMGMGVAVYVIALTQYGALEESVRTEATRGNLPARMCFAVSEARHGQFVIPDYANLDAHRLEAQGEFYWRLGPLTATAPGRGYHMPHDLVREIADRNSKTLRRPLLLYASEHQQVYDERWNRLPEAFVPLAPQAQNVIRTPLPQQDQETAVDIPPATGTDEITADAQMRAQRITDEVADAYPTGAMTPPKVDDTVLRRKIDWQKRHFAQLLQTAGDEGITPGGDDGLIGKTGLSRSFVQDQLRRLTSAGALIKIARGTYRAAPGANVWEAMERIREEDSGLLATAQSA
jgi:hypothetical protein